MKSKTTFKVGDDVIADDVYKGKIIEIEEDSAEVQYEDGDSDWFDFYEIVKIADFKDTEKFMVYGTGCYNKSNLYNKEADCKKEAIKVSTDNSWTGRIIVYKLVPIFEVEKKTVLKKVKLEAKPKKKPKK